MIVLSTLNRTAKSYALGIVAAEYLLRWLPRGTHDWSRFLTPDELEEMLAGCGLTPIDRRGVSYNPLADEWRLSSDCGVNYFITATRPADA
jgi:2-polyprenyl-6-hydroxyphenyl methylase/3-demethylubiquinone-9 3-methyltransferase